MDGNRIQKLLSSGDDSQVFRVGFLLVPNFSMLAFASAIEPLRSANR
ncbi:MAG: GlxA family transcriptional regulator, partial [Alphaproteobacteria bacterium]|nr:GlxA family transcriptional regulator [Alphaproteobacteria bacterium]